MHGSGLKNVTVSPTFAPVGPTTDEPMSTARGTCTSSSCTPRTLAWNTCAVLVRLLIVTPSGVPISRISDAAARAAGGVTRSNARMSESDDGELLREQPQVAR